MRFSLINLESIVEAWGGNCELFFNTVASEEGLFNTKYVPVTAKG
jgi:hypothetical protein